MEKDLFIVEDLLIEQAIQNNEPAHYDDIADYYSKIEEVIKTKIYNLIQSNETKN